MRIDCPYCGLRPVEEFTMKGDASKRRPASSDPADMDEGLAAEWHDYVYLRDNPRGRFEEFWHHAGGCRTWLVVTRDTATHEVYGVITAEAHTQANVQAGGKSA